MPVNTQLDWDYIVSNSASLLADKTAKTELALAAEALTAFNTPLLKDKISSVSTEFKTIFNNMNEASIADMDVANLREDTRLRGTSAVYVPLTPPQGKCIDNAKGFGEDIYGFNLIEILLEYQNWSKMGTYNYYTKLNGVNKDIVITLGRDHTFDLFNNPLVLRKNIIDSKDCVKPI